MPGECRAKKPSITLNLGTNGLKVTSEPPPMAGQAGCLQGQNRSAVTHPSSSHARSYLIWLYCDNCCIRNTAPFVYEATWLLLGWVTAERFCRCKQPAYPAIGGGSEVTFKPLAPS
ncbi:hypothetical protein J6590_049633 [Homalodisca vitripennis]|nr:hypothetical protein J6590_049633 [Homalodisca vitripennis]